MCALGATALGTQWSDRLAHHCTSYHITVLGKMRERERESMLSDIAHPIIVVT